MKYVPETKEECNNLSCGICYYYSKLIEECGYHGEDFGFDYEKCEFR